MEYDLRRVEGTDFYQLKRKRTKLVENVVTAAAIAAIAIAFVTIGFVTLGLRSHGISLF